MISRGESSAIVLLSSYAAVMAPVRSGAVAAARSATNTLTTVLAAALAPHNIRVNAVMPLGVPPRRAVTRPARPESRAARRGRRTDRMGAHRHPDGPAPVARRDGRGD